MAFLDDNYLLPGITAKQIFDTVKNLPIIDPHNHANVSELANNQNYVNPWQVLVGSDHYVWQIMRKLGVLEHFITGNAEPKEKFLALAEILPLAGGNPVYDWLHLDLKNRFGFEQPLDENTAEDCWKCICQKLPLPEFRPLALLNTQNVETMCSTDDPCDLLEAHNVANQKAQRQLVRPTWRPDRALHIQKSDWREYIEKLEQRFNLKINGVPDIISALKLSHDYFAQHGCLASDHDTPFPVSGNTTIGDADAIFKKVMAGAIPTDDDVRQYMCCLTREIAAMDADSGWVYQMHIGVRRNVRDVLFNTIGADAGGDLSDHNIDIVRPLCSFLNKFDGRLKVVLYCLDPSLYADLASIARTFGANIRLGSAWWLCDHPYGMAQQLEYYANVDVLSVTAGMVSDSRKILSYASRFEMYRRTLSAVLGSLVDSGRIPLSSAYAIARQVCYTGPKNFFGF